MDHEFESSKKWPGICERCGGEHKPPSAAEKPAAKTCPLCMKTYTPKHDSKPAAMATTDKESREQWISGVCSTACWDKHMRAPDEGECSKCMDQAMDFPQAWTGKSYSWELNATSAEQPAVLLHWTEAGQDRALCGAVITHLKEKKP